MSVLQDISVHLVIFGIVYNAPPTQQTVLNATTTVTAPIAISVIPTTI
jgi:hypothetical protein